MSSPSTIKTRHNLSSRIEQEKNAAQPLPPRWIVRVPLLGCPPLDREVRPVLWDGRYYPRVRHPCVLVDQGKLVSVNQERQDHLQ